MVLFIMLWLPYNIIVIIAAFSGLNFIPHWLWSLSYWLCYLNSGGFTVRTVRSIVPSASYLSSDFVANRSSSNCTNEPLQAFNPIGYALFNKQLRYFFFSEPFYRVYPLKMSLISISPSHNMLIQGRSNSNISQNALQRRLAEDF